ncbi:hypothetical protein C8R46DRAFT_1037914 [Mycena filopes]|nr:hypothetical protein C8R46DRAFT_1037914 [Mycena filopes]
MDRHNQALIPSRLAANDDHIQVEELEPREVAVPPERVSATHEASLNPDAAQFSTIPRQFLNQPAGRTELPATHRIHAPIIAATDHEVVRDAVLAASSAPFWALKADINFKREPSESVPAIWDSLTSRCMVPSDVLALAWPESHGFGPALPGFGLDNSEARPKAKAKPTPGFGLKARKPGLLAGKWGDFWLWPAQIPGQAKSQPRPRFWLWLGFGTKAKKPGLFGLRPKPGHH